MTEYFDAVISGAGPAGSIAASKIAEKGFKVLLAEKRQELGTPVRCAEGVSEKWLVKHTGVRPEWISAEIKGARLTSPDGSEAVMDYNEKGYILDRSRFDRDLAEEAVSKGAALRTSCPVTGIEREDNAFFVHLGGSWMTTVSTSLVIAADGIESVTARYLGVDTSLKPGDCEFCMQYTLGGVDIDRDRIELIGGNGTAPGGYAWVFPKEEGKANVGLGLLGSRSEKAHNAQYFLDRFVERRFPRCSVVKTVAGMVSASKPLKILCGDRFLIAGDAARLANPLTGAGIGNALESGALAGETAAQGLEAEDLSEDFLSRYCHKVMKSVGDTSKKFYKIKEHFVKFSDKDINNMIRLAKKTDPADLTVGGILELAFKENKAILSMVRKAFE